MTVALGILTFIVVLALLILVHELGHFTMAKLFGVRVQEFGLGFPPRIKTWRRGNTLYSLNALPLGGFVKMLGENGDEVEPDSFGAQAPWKRFVILAAGPVMNVTLAIIIFFISFTEGLPSRYLNVITGVAPKSPAAQVSLLPGDRIVAVDGHPVKYSDSIAPLVKKHLGQPVRLSVQRANSTLTIRVVPRVAPPKNQGPIGITLEKPLITSYGPAKAARLSFKMVGLVVQSLPLLLENLPRDSSQVAGPIGIAQATTQTVQQEPQQGIGRLFQLVAVLSTSLGVLNLLPIPALDGGRILFVLIAWVRRKNVDPEVEGIVHMVGMAALLLLIVLISYQDIVRLVSGGSL